MNKLFECTVLIAVLTAVGAAPVCAAEGGKKKDLGKFGVWRAFVYEEGGQTVCYMATTRAGKTTPKNKGRVPYLMITHRPVEGSTDVFSYGAGISLDSKHNAQLKMGKDSFELFSVKENAWARDSITDHKIAAAVRKSSEAKVVSIPAQGRATTIGDKFPLTGAAMAYRAISKACGVPDYDVKKPEIKKPPSKKPEA
ncbi:MAG: invasion associated locus B family protein, partial [Bdellovibrionales bacterium]